MSFNDIRSGARANPGISKYVHFVYICMVNLCMDVAFEDIIFEMKTLGRSTHEKKNSVTVTNRLFPLPLVPKRLRFLCVILQFIRVFPK